MELYYVNDVYFVVDGHHRVSVARTLNAETIEARVKEFATPLPLDPNTSLEDLILRSAQLDFLETTGLIAETPDDYRTTTANGNERLLEHISGHRGYLGWETHREPTWPEAVLSWRDRVYRPMVQEIRRTEILKDFPDSTETDLYLFVMDQTFTTFVNNTEPASVAPEDAVREFVKGAAKKRRGKKTDSPGKIRRRKRRDAESKIQDILCVLCDLCGESELRT